MTFARATFWNCGIEFTRAVFYDDENFYGIDWVYFSDVAFNEHKPKTPKKKNASVSFFKTDFGNNNAIFRALKFTNCKLSFFKQDLDRVVLLFLPIIMEKMTLILNV